MMKKLISGLAVITLTIQMAGIPASAWEQPAHRRINEAAVNQFAATYGKSSKYNNAQVKLDRDVDAPIVYTSGKFSLSYNQMWSMDAVAAHIREGGYSADEPNVYVSMKHFYDPLAKSGSYELTDQSSAHGLVYEAVPATQWALTRADNPYSLRNAMLYYKKSLEIPSDAAISEIPVTGDFRDFAGKPADVAEMRSMYAGKAMRGLGEVMHLVADMTQPSHVRNDSHPGYEITEQAVNKDEAPWLVKQERVDGLSLSDFGPRTESLMIGLATWTNKNFFSEDTISDTLLGVKPRNWEKPYDSPQLSSLTRKVYERHFTYFAKFGGLEVPMVRSHMGVFYDTYEITADFALKQARVLLPLAVSAAAKTIDNFMPTLELSQTVEEETPDSDLLAKAKAAGAEDLKQYSYDTALTHKTANDKQWEEAGLTIRYSGPGEIWIFRGRRIGKFCNIEYKDGAIVSYTDPTSGETVDGTPSFYIPVGADRKIPVNKGETDFSVEYGDAVFTVVNAGVQSFRSADYVFEQEAPEITIEADRTTIMPGEKVGFTAEITNPPERYRLEWTFGDEEADEENILAPTVSRKKTISHTYEREDEYTATVKLIDTKRKIVRATDTVAISAYMGEMAGPWDVVMTIQEENSFFRSAVVSILKFLSNLIIMPLLRAFGADVNDVTNEFDSFTFVGTTLTYALDLRAVDGSEAEYRGPYSFVSSNTDYIEGNTDITELRMEVKDGKILFYGIATDEYGNKTEIEYLKNGRMVSPGVSEGEFNFSGMMAGTWRATKK